MKKLKEYWCQEKLDFCRSDGTNEAHQEVANMINQEICSNKMVEKQVNYEDWEDYALPEELEILSALPETEQQMVFSLASQQSHCQNLHEWLAYLKQYVSDYKISRNKCGG